MTYRGFNPLKSKGFSASLAKPDFTLCATAARSGLAKPAQNRSDSHRFDHRYVIP